MPNNMTLTRAYEEKRDLVASMTCKRATTTVVNRGYTYDALARPVTRTTARKGTIRNDAFTYNSRSELASATLGANGYGYGYDNIGNRKTAQELADELTYASNNLNQYTSITRSTLNSSPSTLEEPFVPAYDANGNQTLVKTATGLWTVQYDANNRPVSFTKAEAESTTVVECGYDYMGRRYMKKVKVNGTVALHHRYIYRGYLQVACCDLKRSAHPCLWLITWDPTDPVATRPLAIQKDGTWYCYGHDLTKNAWEIFGSSGYIRTAYDYTPYGGVVEEGDVAQPVQWSSEMYDDEFALVYYNYRYYNPLDGRWINRDPIAEDSGWNLYVFLSNSPFYKYDSLGMWSKVEGREDTWCAEKNDKTLSSLATQKYHAHEDDAACIWPVGNTQGDGYPNGVQPGDIYDASNLSDSLPANKHYYSLSRAFLNDGDVYNISYTFADGASLPSILKKISGEGATPITELLINGHGNSGFYGIAGTSGLGETTFMLQDLMKLNIKATFSRAKLKKGPLRCWFSRNATVRFSACKTRDLAYQFSQTILRNKGLSWGTRHTIAVHHGVIWGTYLRHYDDNMVLLGETGNGAGIHSATWIAFRGAL